MAVTPEQSARFIVRRRKRQDALLDVRFDAMRHAAERIVAVIAQRYRPTRVYQWGSLLDRSRFRRYSDVDIAVEGVTDSRTWESLERTVWDLCEFPLDLVQLERVEPEYAEIIRMKGALVYERSE